MSLFMTDEFSESLKNYFKDKRLTHSQQTFLFFVSFFLLNEMAIVSKVPKPDNNKSHSSLKLSFTNICSFHSHFVDYQFFPQ